jgi:hypothetical protein
MKAALRALVLVLVAGAVPASAQDEIRARPIARVLSGPSGVSVTAEAVPLDDLLREVSRVTGIAVFFESSLPSSVVRRPTSVAVRDAPLEAVLKRVLRDINFIVSYGPERADAVRIFGQGGGPGPFTRLGVGSAAGRRPDSSADAQAQRSEEDSDSADDIPTLERAALTHPDPAQRASAMQRLSEIGEEGRARNVALAALDRDQDTEVLREALNLLETHDSLPRESLMRFASGSRPAELRLQALDMLADSGTTDAAFRSLVTALARDPSEEVRQRAQELLEDLDLKGENAIRGR